MNESRRLKNTRIITIVVSSFLLIFTLFLIARQWLTNKHISGHMSEMAISMRLIANLDNLYDNIESLRDYWLVPIETGQKNGGPAGAAIVKESYGILDEISILVKKKVLDDKKAVLEKDRLKKAITALNMKGKAMIDAANSGASVLSYEIQFDRQYDKTNKILKNLMRLLQSESTVTTRHVLTELRKATQWALFQIIGLFLLLFGAAVLVYIFMQRFLINRLYLINNLVNRIAKGELPVEKVPAGSKDAVQALALSFNNMVESLRQTRAELKDAVESERAARTYAESVINVLNDSLITIDAKRKIKDLNSAAIALLGYKQEELLGKHIDFILSEGEGLFRKENLLEEMRSTMQGDEHYINFIAKSGEVIPVLLTLLLLDGKTADAQTIICQARDLRLVRINRKLNLMNELALIGLTSASFKETAQKLTNTIMKYFHAAASSFFIPQGTALKAVYASDFFGEIEVGKGRGIAGYTAETKRIYFTNDPYDDRHFEPVFDEKSGFITKNILAIPLLENGELNGVLEFLNKKGGFEPLDIKEAQELTDFTNIIIMDKRREEALKQSELKYRGIIDNMYDVFFRTRIDGVFEMISPSVERYGYKADELIGKNVAEFLTTPGERDDYLKILMEEKEILNYEVRLKDTSGNEIIALLSSHLILDNAGNPRGSEGVLRDVTQERRLQEQFLQAQKLTTVGKLTGGVAHDFNNLLTAISGFTEFALLNSGDKAVVEESMKEVSRAADSAAALVKKLLIFSKKQNVSPEKININKRIKDMYKMLRRMISEDISFNFSPAKKDMWIKSDPTQIEQLLVNLVVNARDAINMKGSGSGNEITVATDKIYMDERASKNYSSLALGHYAVISVSDTGIGIDADTKTKLFDPFFTTKESGTGLGLSTVYGIVQQNHGTISVYSEPGRGAVFKILWPLLSGEAEEKKTVAAADEIVGGNETILLVEDQETVRKYTKSVLGSLGYNVIDAEDGEAAMELFAEKKNNIDLLLTDVIMSRMSGVELAEKIRAIIPDMKVLFCSGYTDDKLKIESLHNDCCDFITKPFSMRPLNKKIRALLNKKE